MRSLDWTKLKDKRCPQCGSELREVGALDSSLACDHCGFCCGIDRAEEIVGDISGKNIDPLEQQADDFLRSHGIKPLKI